MINALDFLSDAQRDAVLNYRPIAGGIGKQLKDAVDKAIQHERGDSLYLPGGLWLIRANNGRDILSGWRISIPDNKSLLIFGDGDATIIRREATETLVKTSPLIGIVANDQINISFQNLLFDGNEAHCPVDPSDPFAYEQSANVKFLGSGNGIPNNITFDNVAMTGCVGDGFHANVKIQSLQVSNWRSYGRTRRPRADIQLSLIPLQVTNVTNFIGDAFEMEPSEVNAEHIINLNNMLVRGKFDFAGDKVEQQFANVYASNVTHLGQFDIGSPISNFNKIRGEFVNCQFVNIDRIQNCQIKFNGGTFTVLGKATQPTEGVQIIHDRADNFVEFNGVAFDVRGEVTSESSYFLKNKATSDVGRETRFINCRTVRKLDYFANANRNGTMLFDGGQIGGRIAAVKISHGGGVVRPEYITRAIIKNPEQWTSTLIDIKLVSDNISDKIKIEMYGQFNAEIQQPIFNSTSQKNENITWIGGFTAAVASDPNGRIRGLPGLILRKSEPTTGEIVEWQYKQGKTYASMQYDPVTV
jgi:hypothetical protein